MGPGFRWALSILCLRGRRYGRGILRAGMWDLGMHLPLLEPRVNPESSRKTGPAVSASRLVEGSALCHRGGFSGHSASLLCAFLLQLPAAGHFLTEPGSRGLDGESDLVICPLRPVPSQARGWHPVHQASAGAWASSRFTSRCPGGGVGVAGSGIWSVCLSAQIGRAHV